MCQQACPAECITIVAGEHPKVAYEKYPVVFDIDMMRCVFCGFCVDACPKDAIWMTRNYEMAFFTREDAVFSIDRLRETPEEIAKHGYSYQPYYPGDGTTPRRTLDRPGRTGQQVRGSSARGGGSLPDRDPARAP
jgi:formate hydrogenlyase subunit 6/NADH:ubiquinone oxidoreductase subunit I